MSPPASSFTPPQPWSETLAGTSLLTQFCWYICQVQNKTNFQGFSCCHLTSSGLALSSLLLAIGFPSQLSLFRSFPYCCSNLFNSVLIPCCLTALLSEFLGEGNGPAGIIPVHWARLRDQPSSNSHLLPCLHWRCCFPECCFSSACYTWSTSLPRQVISLSVSSSHWWCLCSLQVWLLKLLLTHFLCWYHMGWEHGHTPLPQPLWSRHFCVLTGSF